MTSLRITGDPDRMRARAARRVGRNGGTVPDAHAVSGQRVRVTRSDLGAGWRLAASPAELAAHGAVNPRSTAREPGGIGGGRYTVADQDSAYRTPQNGAADGNYSWSESFVHADQVEGVA